MRSSVKRRQRKSVRILIGLLVVTVFLVAVIWGGHTFYVRWQEKRLLVQATAEIERGNDREADLTARTMLGLNPSSASAARLMAQLAERRGDRAALDWRRKVVLSEPNSTHDTLALARCALQFNDVATAGHVLDGVAPSGRNNADFHAACALLAQTTHDDEKADREWSEASRLAPQDASYQLQLGTLRLRSDDVQRHASGEAILTAVRGNPAQRVAATRALIIDGARRHINNDALLAMAQELQAYPEALFSDRILYADILRQLRAPEFTKYLTSLEQDAVSKPEDLTALISWMSTSGLSLVAIDFSHTVPAETLAKLPVPIAMAEAYAKLGDWPALQVWLQDKDWGHSDFMRHAYLALALRGQNKTADVEKEWALAQKEASAQPAFLSLLTRTTSEWRWKKEWLELLWTLTKYPETQFEALQHLYQQYSDDSDTAGLYRVLLRLVDVLPENDTIQNNFAQVSLLLDADVDRARKIAMELHTKDPSNPAYAATYAFSLYTKRDVTSALKIMQSLDPKQLHDPPIAAYYGILLAAAGDTEKAREYLKLGASAKLLPEEKRLVTGAEKSPR